MNKIVQQLHSLLTSGQLESAKIPVNQTVALVSQTQQSLELTSTNHSSLSSSLQFSGRDLPALPKEISFQLVVDSRNGPSSGESVRLLLPINLTIVRIEAATAKWMNDQLNALLAANQRVIAKIEHNAQGRVLLVTPQASIPGSSQLPGIQSWPPGARVELKGITELVAKIIHQNVPSSLVKGDFQVESQKNGQLFLRHPEGTLVLKTPLNIPTGQTVSVAIDAKSQAATLSAQDKQLLAVSVKAVVNELLLTPLVPYQASPDADVKTPATDSYLQQLLRLLLPIQRPAADNLTRLLQTLSDPKNTMIPIDLKNYGSQLAQQIPTPAQLTDLKPRQIRALLIFSALMQSRQGSNRPVANLQMQLLQGAATIIQTQKALTAWQQLPPMPFKMTARTLSLPAPNNLPLQLTPNPFLGPNSSLQQRRDATPMTRQFHHLTTEWLRQTADLLKTVESGLARQQVVNLQLAKSDTSPNLINFEVPLQIGNRIEGVEVGIKRKQKKRQPTNNDLSMSLNFDLEKLGRVKVLVNLKNEKVVSTRFFSEKDSTAATFANHFSELKAQLERQGVTLEHCDSQQAEVIDEDNPRKDISLVNLKA